ncbi:hypothetical protein [Endozoicomonas lisbonensis]|uniref:hypothetical protein n=1 Tax=Endozoicomonas lisbonensis TaxID=3120522 RepID=UPI003399EF4B
MLLSGSMIISLSVGSTSAAPPIKDSVPVVRGAAPELYADPASLPQLPQNGDPGDTQRRPEIQINHYPDSQNNQQPSDDTDGLSNPDELVVGTNRHMAEMYDGLRSRIHSPDVVDGAASPSWRFQVHQSLPFAQPVQALQYILASPNNYTLTDIYFVLHNIANQANEPGLATLFHDSAGLIHLYINQGDINFNQLTNTQPGWEGLQFSLRNLQGALERNNAPLSMWINYAYSSLYNSINLIVRAEIEMPMRTTGSHTEASSRLLTFLYEMAILSTHSSEVSRHLEGSAEAYASSRVWYFFDHYMMQNYRSSPEGIHMLHVLYSATDAYYLLFLGRVDESYARMQTLSEIEPTYQLGEHNRDVDSILAWIVSNTLYWLSQQNKMSEYNTFIRILFFIMKYPHLPHAPNDMILAGRIEVLQRLQELLSKQVLRSSFSFNEALFDEIADSELFDQRILERIRAEKAKAQQKQDQQNQQQGQEQNQQNQELSRKDRKPKSPWWRIKKK